MNTLWGYSTTGHNGLTQVRHVEYDCTTRTEPLEHKKLRGQIAPKPRFVKLMCFDLRVRFRMQSESPVGGVSVSCSKIGNHSLKPHAYYGSSREGRPVQIVRIPRFPAPTHLSLRTRRGEGVARVSGHPSSSGYSSTRSWSANSWSCLYVGAYTCTRFSPTQALCVGYVG
jgi:hypothetical protein